MKIILKTTRRKRTENGFVFNEKPQIIPVNVDFPNSVKEEGCQCSPKCCNFYTQHVATVPFGKYYSKCEVENNECIPEDSLTYEEGRYDERKICNCCGR